MLAFLVIRACEVQIASLAGAATPDVPTPDVVKIVPDQAKIITDGNTPFPQMTWRALLRKLDREMPDYKT